MATAAAETKKGTVLEVQSVGEDFQVVCCIPGEKVERFLIPEGAIDAFIKGMNEGFRVIRSRKTTERDIAEYIRDTGGDLSDTNKQARVNGISCAAALDSRLRIWPKT